MFLGYWSISGDLEWIKLINGYFDEILWKKLLKIKKLMRLEFSYDVIHLPVKYILMENLDNRIRLGVTGYIDKYIYIYIYT